MRKILELELSGWKATAVFWVVSGVVYALVGGGIIFWVRVVANALRSR